MSKGNGYKRRQVKLTNDFHNTEANVLVEVESNEIGYQQVNRARRLLCGMDDCSCGDAAGARPAQIEQISQGRTKAEARYALIV